MWASPSLGNFGVAPGEATPFLDHRTSPGGRNDFNADASDNYTEARGSLLVGYGSLVVGWVSFVVVVVVVVVVC